MAANAVARNPLSASTNYRGVKVVATASAGTTIHATGTSSTTIDQVTLYAYNSDTVSRALTIEFGGTTAPDDNIKVTVPSQAGLMLICQLPLTGTGAAASTIKAFASAANVVVMFGWVDRVTP